MYQPYSNGVQYAGLVSPQGFRFTPTQLTPTQFVPFVGYNQYNQGRVNQQVRNYNAYDRNYQDPAILYAKGGNKVNDRSNRRRTGHTGPYQPALDQHKKQRNQHNVTPPPARMPMQRGLSDSISRDIWDYYGSSKQTDEIYQDKVNLRNALFAILKGVFPYCGLYMVGSSMSGFGTKTSDMDLCLMISPHNLDGKKDAIEVLFPIQRALRKLGFIRSCQIIRARVPILKFEDGSNGVECDLNINNSVGIRNTHLLKYYSEMDWRVIPLVLFLKKWARFHDINDASKRTISSYSLCLMLIHYLQHSCRPPVLQSLQKLYPNVFNVNIEIHDLEMNLNVDFKSENTTSLGEVFLGFLRYYSEEFDFETDVASVRLGNKIPIHMVKRYTPASELNMWGCLKVEEPFDLSNTSRSCYDAATFSRVCRVFRKSYATLSRRLELNALLTTPF